MAGRLIRFGVSLEQELLEKFDSLMKAGNYTNRSEAIRGLIRDELVKNDWKKGANVTGSIMFVYDHHKRQLLNRLMDVQHDHHHDILSTQHIHMDHHNCLEIVVVRGKAEDIQQLYIKLKSLKGIKHINIAMSTTGEEEG